MHDLAPLWTVSMLLKITAALLTAWLVTLGLRRSSAALRHLVWSAALLAVLALPLLSALPWRLPVILPQQAAIEHAGSGAGDSPAGTGMAAPESAPQERTDGAAPAISQPISTTPARGRPSWPVLLVAIWAAGALILLGRLGVGGLVVARLARRATPLDVPEWTRPLVEGADRLGLPRLPALLMSHRLPMPFACGLFRPTIILPAGADEWDDRRRRAVLCHELAHLRRLDLPVSLLGQIACAVHWFNPLVWMAVRRMRIESERACDDLVLGAGTRPSEYADHLLQIVCRSARTRPPAVVLPMAQRREFEGRMLAILERDARREPLTRRRAAGLAALTLVLVLPLAALAPATGSSAAKLPEPASRNTSETAEPLPTTTNREVRVDSSTSTPSHREQETRTVTSNSAAPAPTPAPAPQPWDGKIRNLAAAAADTNDPRVVTGLLHALEDSVPAVRANAAFALGELAIRSAAGPMAARLQRESNSQVRDRIIWALGQLESRDAVPALQQVIQRDSSEELRSKAVWALGQIQDPAALPALITALGDRSPEVRGKAAWALGQLEPRTAPKELIAALRDGSAEVRRQAAWALGQIEDTAAVAGLMTTLGDSVTKVRRTALWALGQMESPVTQPALLRALNDPDPEIRAAAAHALGNTGGN